MIAVLSTNAYMFLSLSFVLQVPSENGRGVTEKLTVLIPPRPESPALWGYLCQLEAWKKLEEVPGVAPSLALLAVVGVTAGYRRRRSRPPFWVAG